MAITISTPTNPESVGNTGHTTDHNTIVTALTTLANSAANTSGDTFSGQMDFSSIAPLHLPYLVTTSTSNSISASASSAGLYLLSPSASCIFNLPAPTGLSGLQYTIKNVNGTQAISVTPSGVTTIDGSSSYVIPASAGAYVQVITNGSNWFITDQSLAFTVYRTTASSSLTSTTPATVGLSTSIGPGTYRINSQIYALQGGTAGEIGVKLITPSSGSDTGELSLVISRSTTFVGQVSGAPNALIGAAVALSASQIYATTVTGLIVVTATGTLDLQCYCVGGAGSYVVNPFSYIDVVLLPV
jgi:hypothetical protein